MVVMMPVAAATFAPGYCMYLRYTDFQQGRGPLHRQSKFRTGAGPPSAAVAEEFRRLRPWLMMPVGGVHLANTIIAEITKIKISGRIQSR